MLTHALKNGHDLLDEEDEGFRCKCGEIFGPEFDQFYDHMFRLEQYFSGIQKPTLLHKVFFGWLDNRQKRIQAAKIILREARKLRKKCQLIKGETLLLKTFGDDPDWWKEENKEYTNDEI